MSQKSLQKNKFTPDECLPNFYLKFDFLERPKKRLLSDAQEIVGSYKILRKCYLFKTQAIQEKLIA